MDDSNSSFFIFKLVILFIIVAFELDFVVTKYTSCVLGALDSYQ